MSRSARERVEFGRVLKGYSVIEDTGLPAYRCFPSEYYRDPGTDDKEPPITLTEGSINMFERIVKLIPRS